MLHAVISTRNFELTKQQIGKLPVVFHSVTFLATDRFQRFTHNEFLLEKDLDSTQ